MSESSTLEFAQVPPAPPAPAVVPVAPAPAPPSAAPVTPVARASVPPLRRVTDALRHPNNHKQAFRFLCVGASGYVVNTVTFAVCIHLLSIWDTGAFAIAFLAGTANNFWWNRNWTFDAAHHHIGKQGTRFLLVSAFIALCAFGVYQLLAQSTGMEKVIAEALAYVIVTPLSFVVQKLWSFKA